MKSKLYHRFVKLVCKTFGITRKQLFSRDFNNHIVPCYNFDVISKKLIRDTNSLMMFSREKPLSVFWDAYDFYTRWLLKYWKHSHWKSFIQTHLDLGVSLDDVLKKILKKH